MMLHRVETEKARAAAHAQDDAQSQVQGEVSRILCVERAAGEGSIQQAVIRERIATEDERLRAQLFVSLSQKHTSMYGRFCVLILCGQIVQNI